MYCIIVLALSLLAVSTAAPTTSQCPTQSVQEAKKAETALDNFAMNIYKNVTSQDEDANQVLSPVSIALALALLENGANGATRQEIQNQLVQNSGDHQNVLSIYHALQKNLQMDDHQQGARLQVANGVFADNQIQLVHNYKQSTQQCMDAEIQQLDFNKQPEESRKSMNQWVAKKTMDKIPELFPQGAVTGETKAALANAIHFKASWATSFDEADTKMGTFYPQGREEQNGQQVKFMKSIGQQHGHYEDDKVQVLELMYDKIETAMYILLPKQREGLKELEGQLNGDQLKSILGKVSKAQVDLQLPKFLVRSSVNLQQMLTKMGLNTLFGSQADFSRMTEEKLQISAAVHQAYINVHENGTEAAAATGFAINRSSSTSEKVEFIADHPFIYTILHKPTGAILFIGKINKVEQQ